MKNCFLIVNYNDYKSTKHLVDNIIDFKCVDEILIVDNNSSEEEKNKLKTIKDKKIDVLFSDDNGGYGAAINKGSRWLIDEYKKCNIIFSNSDIIIMSENDLVKLIETLDYDSIGLVAPQVLECGTINKGWKCPTPMMDVWLNIPLLHKYIRKQTIMYKEDYYEGDLSVVDVVSGCFFLIRSDILKSVNFMDENIFLYYEENILCKKVRDKDLLVVIKNDVKIKHNHSVSIDKSVKVMKKYYMLKKSQFYFQTTYNNANRFEKFMLKFSAGLSGKILTIYHCLCKK